MTRRGVLSSPCAVRAAPGGVTGSSRGDLANRVSRAAPWCETRPSACARICLQAPSTSERATHPTFLTPHPVPQQHNTPALLCTHFRHPSRSEPATHATAALQRRHTRRCGTRLSQLQPTLPTKKAQCQPLCPRRSHTRPQTLQSPTRATLQHRKQPPRSSAACTSPAVRVCKYRSRPHDTHNASHRSLCSRATAPENTTMSDVTSVTARMMGSMRES